MSQQRGDTEMFKFYSTPSHGYLQVYLSELGDWVPSEYSFQCKGYAFLEEDNDAHQFIADNHIPHSKIIGLSIDCDIRELMNETYTRFGLV